MVLLVCKDIGILLILSILYCGPLQYLGPIRGLKFDVGLYRHVDFKSDKITRTVDKNDKRSKLCIWHMQLFYN